MIVCHRDLDTFRRDVFQYVAAWIFAVLLSPFGLPIHASGQDTDSVATEASAADRSAPVSVYGYPALQVNQDSIVGLLVDGRFSDLEGLLESLEAETRADIRREVEFEAAYRSFHGPDASIGVRLDEWVTQSPGSDAALVARAQFRLARAWEARGAGRTPEDVEALRQVWAEGTRDAQRAIEMDPDNLAAYVVALRLLQFGGWSPEAEAVIEAALARFPTSYWLRFRALSLMEPRWGGSHELMSRFASDAQRHVGENPRLGVLPGLPLVDEAATLRLARRYDDALQKLEEARRFGTDWHFYYARGLILFRGDRPTEAVAALDSAIAILPVASTLWENRGAALFEVAERDVAPDQRARYLDLSIADYREAVKRSYADSGMSDRLADILATRAQCRASPDDCLAGTDSRGPLPWWLNAILFVVSLPYTLYMVFAEGQRMHLLPMPLIALGLCVWSFVEWRRQTFWTPVVVHVLAVLALASIVAINIAWVLAGGEMWAQRYVVIAIFPIFPYLVYLVLLGPHTIGRRRASSDAVEGRLEED